MYLFVKLANDRFKLLLELWLFIDSDFRFLIGRTFHAALLAMALRTPQSINMSPNAYIGLVLTSHQSGVLYMAEFSNVTITGVTGPWQIADIGMAQPGNDAQPLYVVLQDSVNKTAVVKYPNSAATTIGTWTEWNIELAQFTGVNPRAIKKLSIGVGNRTNPQRGGSGTLYIDDIRLYGPPPTQ